jgi:flavodoxin
MRSVVVYDSRFGNTEAIAHVIARALGEFGPARAAHVHETAVTQLRDVDLLVLGCPTQGWDPTSDMRIFVERLPREVLRGPKVACFDTRPHLPRWIGRFAAPQLAGRLKKLQIEPIAPPEGFYVERPQGPFQAGEFERAAEWARRIGETARGLLANGPASR